MWLDFFGYHFVKQHFKIEYVFFWFLQGISLMWIQGYPQNAALGNKALLRGYLYHNPSIIPLRKALSPGGGFPMISIFTSRIFTSRISSGFSGNTIWGDVQLVDWERRSDQSCELAYANSIGPSSRKDGKLRIGGVHEETRCDIGILVKVVLKGVFGWHVSGSNYTFGGVNGLCFLSERCIYFAGTV